jgi:hypothetical protein
MGIAAHPIHERRTHEAYPYGFATPNREREFLSENGINLFSMGYDLLASFDISTISASSYQDVAPNYVSNVIACSSVPYAKTLRLCALMEGTVWLSLD